MEPSEIQKLLELVEGPAFAQEDGVIRFADPQAAVLGLKPGAALSALFPGLSLPEALARAEGLPVELAGEDWFLHAVAVSGTTLCVLRPLRTRIAALGEHTLIHTAGSIRLALQDLMVSLDSLSDLVCEDAESAGQAALALRSVYRLRRTAGDLELLAALCAGSFRLCRHPCRPVAATADLCAEMEELLRPAGRSLRCKLPQGELPCCLDWPLAAALLRELIANAAANSADGQIDLSLTRVDRDRLRFAVRSTPAEGQPEALLRPGKAQTDLWGGAELSLSLVSIGAECHGGGLLLSSDRAGAVTALLTLRSTDQEDETVRSPIQLPQDRDANLIALSQVLPPSCYRPEDLL